MAERAFFDIFNKLDREKYDPVFSSCSVYGVKIQREQRILLGELNCPEYISYRMILPVLADIKQVYALSKLSLNIHYIDAQFDESKWQDVISFVHHESNKCNGFFNDSKINIHDNILTVSLQHGGLSIIRLFKIDQMISKTIHNWFGIDFTLEFDGITEVTADNNQINECPLPEIAPPPKTHITPPAPKPATKAPSPAPFRRQPVEVDPAMVFGMGEMPYDVSGAEILKGKKLGDKFFKLSQLGPDSGKVTVVGQIFFNETRPTWDKKNTRVKLYITDQTSSFVVKFPENTDKFDQYSDSLSVGKCIAVYGDIVYDKYEEDIVLQATTIATAKKKKSVDPCEEKRVELHLHTKMSSMDATNEIGDFVKRAAEWGHKAIAITDHGNVQAFPQACAAGKDNGVKIIYGMEGYLINDMTSAVVFGDADCSFDDAFVVFDLETTGLSAAENHIIEIGAVKIKEGKVIEEYNTFVNPGCPIPSKITELTGITDEMVADAPGFEQVFDGFCEFCGNDTIMVAHNANFDIGFLRAEAERIGRHFTNTYIDTVPLCRYAFPDMRSVKLNLVADRIHLPKFNHHRAVDDAKVLSDIFIYLTGFLREHDKMSSVSDIRTQINQVDYKSKSTRYTHIILLVKNKVGLKNLYKLVTKSSLDHFFKKPLIFKSELAALRDGLIIGSACEAGELFRAVVAGKTEEELLELAGFYDFLEVQPIGNNMYMLRNGTVGSVETLRNFNRKIISLADTLGKPVCATCDAHFLNKNDEVFRRILQAGQGYADADQQPPLYYRNTKEMLAEFDYLDANKAHEIVVTNPNAIADMCEEIIPIPEGMYPPTIDGCEDELREIAMKNAKEIYGDPIPKIVYDRMTKELDSIIGNGYAVMYMIAQKLVKKSNDDGYFVGSRGSVGSSFAANIVGISEVNPLIPHYRCPNCKHIEWFENGEVGSGFDLPDKDCPECGTRMKCDGHDIPFETFLGFKGDKVPDIDLNFSGVYQPVAHHYIETMFGDGYVFKAGTIGTLADKTAYGFVKKYLEAKGTKLNKAEEQRLIDGCVGTKRTTGQHPAGMVVIPRGYDVYDFCPVQHPADDQSSTILTTHFDFHSLHDTILKFDILGHDVPTLLRKLCDLTGVPFETIPMNDPTVYSLLESPKALGVTAEQIDCETGTLALPEMGTNFVRGMLLQAKPKNFSDLLQISGLSHGTDVWIGNAADLIDQGVCTISEVIGTRDNIMVYLIHKGMEPSLAFKIMEIVRKGKAKKLLTEDMIQAMYDCGCPEWYVESCMKIKYMFPKAHAAAYVMGAIRLGWYKIHYPLEFYAAHFSVRPDGFDALEVAKGEGYLRNIIKSIENLGKQAKATDTDKVTTYQVVIEAMERGVEFLPVNIDKSAANDFTVEDGKIRMPFSVFSGVGGSAAESIAAARDKGGFLSQEDFRVQSGVSKTIIELFNKEGVFGSLPATSQMTFF